MDCCIPGLIGELEFELWEWPGISSSLLSSLALEIDDEDSSEEEIYPSMDLAAKYFQYKVLMIL